MYKGTLYSGSAGSPSALGCQGFKPRNDGQGAAGGAGDMCRAQTVLAQKRIGIQWVLYYNRSAGCNTAVSYTHLRAHETGAYL
eukprot:298833-Pyramimonas_sp.AAC.1